jgi:hypothetical protein
MIISLNGYKNIRNLIDLYTEMEDKGSMRGMYIEKDL